jgi:uncharacterized protein YcbK (DUF882 family)
MRQGSRRDFLKTGVGFFASCLLPSAAWAALLPDDTRRTLSFYNTHTAERLSVCYYSNGAYRPDALARIDHILRDHRTGEVKSMDPQLLDLLASVQGQLGCSAPFHIISGYRSPETNAQLRKRTTGVAKFSYHMLGRAIDIRLPGCDTRRLRKACLAYRKGGVGYYPRSDFVHLDTGSIRTWKG